MRGARRQGPSPASHQRRAYPPRTEALLRWCGARRGRRPTAAGCSADAGCPAGRHREGTAAPRRTPHKALV